VLIGAHVPDLNWNKTVWGSTYGWQAGGEEWSETWGSSEAQWFGSIFPRLHRFLPARRILENRTRVWTMDQISDPRMR
jgi:hypothetical protein